MSRDFDSREVRINFFAALLRHALRRQVHSFLKYYFNGAVLTFFWLAKGLVATSNDTTPLNDKNIIKHRELYAYWYNICIYGRHFVNDKTPSDDKNFIIYSIGCKITSTLNETGKYRHLPLMIQNLYH